MPSFQPFPSRLRMAVRRMRHPSSFNVPSLFPSVLGTSIHGNQHPHPSALSSLRRIQYVCWCWFDVGVRHDNVSIKCRPDAQHQHQHSPTSAMNTASSGLCPFHLILVIGTTPGSSGPHPQTVDMATHSSFCQSHSRTSYQYEAKSLNGGS